MSLRNVGDYDRQNVVSVSSHSISRLWMISYTMVITIIGLTAELSQVLQRSTENSFPTRTLFQNEGWRDLSSFAYTVISPLHDACFAAWIKRWNAHLVNGSNIQHGNVRAACFFAWKSSSENQTQNGHRSFHAWKPSLIQARFHARISRIRTVDLMNRINAMLRKAFKSGYSKQCDNISKLIEQTDNKLFKSLQNKALCTLLPPQSQLMSAVSDVEVIIIHCYHAS